jgi:glyoxylase-like metal-dependent hydrolase (beta-lactamase superfamily II)
MRHTFRLAALAVLFAGPAMAQGQDPILGDTTTKVSEHVWAIMGWPNIGIVVGTRATLVVDTGLGPRNGATIARVAAGLSKTQKLFLTTTHFHPEHAGGEAGFPPGTILIRNAVQQEEAAQRGMEMVKLFGGRNAQWGELLAGVTSLRTPDVVYDSESAVDLGGVTVKLLWLGEGHTKGDELILVEPDGTLISGDIVQNKVVPGINAGGTPSSWIGILDKLAKLDVKRVLPDHSPVGDASLIAAERAFIVDLRTRALALKGQGVSAQDAGMRLSAEFRMKYSDWPAMNVGGFVQRIYEER